MAPRRTILKKDRTTVQYENDPERQDSFGNVSAGARSISLGGLILGPYELTA